MKDRDRRMTISHHMFLNMRFVWEFLDDNLDIIKNKDIKIYTDTDVNNCKLRFKYQGYDLEFRPDVLIKVRSKYDKTNKKLIMVENDTGTENTIQIYRKFVRYGFYLDKTHILKDKLKEDIYFPDVKLYFMCTSKQRLHNIFIKGNLAKYFKMVNSFKGRFHLKTKKYLELLEKDYFGFYIMNWEDYEPEEFDLKSTIKKNSLFRSM
jgi:hypothetical protein